MAEVQEFPRNPNDSLVPITWAEGGNATEPSSGRKLTGYESLDTVSEAEINWLSQEPMRAIRALQSRAPLASDALFSNWLVRNGIWADGNNPLEGFLSDSGLTDSLVADVWVDPYATGAVRMQVSVSLGSPHLFTASRSTYIGVPVDVVAPPSVTEPELLYTVLNLGDPEPLASPGYVYIWRVDTDANSISAQEILVQTRPVFSTVFISLLGVLGNVEIAGTLLVEGATTLAGDIDMAGNNIVNGGAVSCATLVTSGGASIGSNLSVGGSLDMTLGNITNAVDIGCSGLVAAADVVAGGALQGTTLATTGAIQCGGNLDMTNGSISNVTTLTASTSVTAPTVDTSSSAGIVKVGEAQFYSDSSPSTTTGVIQSFGRGLTYGLESTARRVAIPVDNYVATLPSTASSTATGASVSVTLATGDVVYVTASADLENTGTGTVIVFEIVIDGSIQNSPGDLRSDVAGVPITCSRTVKYTAVGNSLVTFVQRYGATANLTEGKNGFISVRQGN